MNKERLLIRIEGVVQGVGFRPFIYRLAEESNLKGYVRNTSKGVEIEVEGDRNKVDKFPSIIKKKAPPLARINRISTQNISFKGDSAFNIKNSNNTSNTIAMIPPDISICNDCVNDITTPDNRRYQYPFTNCTNCGPRFSIIKNLPYDRSQTTMKSFEMCKKCKKEYNNSLNRRYHAQPNACPECGPHIWLLKNSGDKYSTSGPIKTTIRLLKQGKIIAVKGLGGFHLMCDAKNKKVVTKLRKRKKRPEKPLALMMDDISTVGRYCYISEKEEDILKGKRKPILLLDKKRKKELAGNIAPGSKYYGIMLPYTPLHYLLLNDNLKVIVATSGNISGNPIEFKNESAYKSLRNVADYFLMHNREIYLPVDDSVVRVIMDKERLLRRARGYVPYPVKVKGLQTGLALGAEQKNTNTSSKENYAFLSQHLGKLRNKSVYDNFKIMIKHFNKLYNLKPDFIAHDLHPDYQSTHHVNKMIYVSNSKDIKQNLIKHSNILQYQRDPKIAIIGLQHLAHLTRIRSEK